jgi:hypothetical protein
MYKKLKIIIKLKKVIKFLVKKVIVLTLIIEFVFDSLKK